ncbi:protein translocase subunit SecD [Pirellulimonas nuda]|nr:protein translocase subunit SecD [Pirellulimonas nuda]
MNHPFRKLSLVYLVASALVVVAYSASPRAALAQDGPAVSAPAEQSEPGDQPAADPTADAPAEDAEQPAKPESTPPAAEGDSDAEAESAEAPASGDGPSGAGTAEEATAEKENPEADPAAAGAAPASGETPISWPIIGTVLAVVLLPIPIGSWIAGRLKMPDHGWKIALVLGVIAACVLAITFGEFKGGPDLSGGIILIYELEEPDNIATKEELESGETDRADNKKVDINQLIDAIKQRVDPSGTKEVSIRQYGTAVEVIIPNQDAADLAYIKRLITDLGSLEFRILADPAWDADTRLIDQANLAGPSQKIVELGGQPAGRWVEYDVAEFGAPGEADPRMVVRNAGGRPEALVKLDRWDVTGEYLDKALAGYDDEGRPAVDFIFDDSGAKRFGRLTRENQPKTGASQLRRRLGVLLDNKLRQAPSLNSPIDRRGQITGMNKEEVDVTVGILNAGSLPAALNKEPISEEVISPTLGKTTVEKGSQAIAVSLAAVLVFMLFYYRFAGLVACLALAMNLLIVLGVMVLIKAAFTLPGLAGLVLTVGMSVDANVLIFERIREELSRGASLRMAIRNGFGRATTTIVDSNLTTLITGAVLYAIGTDQVKGFAVTLVIGILASMFTAIFCSRLVFDIAERRRWIKDLKFSRIIGDTNIDFLGKCYAASVFSLLVIGAGMTAVVMRGDGLLDIDFTGGASVTMALDESAPSNQREVTEALKKTELADANLTVVERGTDGTRFTVTTSIDDPDRVKEVLSDAFGDQLKTYAVAPGEAKPYAAGGVEGAEIDVKFNNAEGFSDDDGLGHDALTDRVRTALAAEGIKGLEPVVTTPGYTEGSSQRFKVWTIRLGGVEPAQLAATADRLADTMTNEPIFPLANKIGGKVAGDMRWTALEAMLVSLLGIVGYIWFRFQNIAYGVAAVVALVHDVLVTLGALGLSYYIATGVPALASAIQIDPFQVSLTIVAALLTIIGYSLNDTIVIFDRIREVKGKSPRLTKDMINLSVNQTLSRTLLTSLTTLIVVVILYFAGGSGIHGFAFALVVGVIAGTYSTVFIAAPLLLTLAGTEGTERKPAGASAA